MSTGRDIWFENAPQCMVIRNFRLGYLQRDSNLKIKGKKSKTRSLIVNLSLQAVLNFQPGRFSCYQDSNAQKIQSPKISPRSSRRNRFGPIRGNQLLPHPPHDPRGHPADLATPKDSNAQAARPESLHRARVTLASRRSY